MVDAAKGYMTALNEMFASDAVHDVVTAAWQPYDFRDYKTFPKSEYAPSGRRWLTIEDGEGFGPTELNPKSWLPDNRIDPNPYENPDSWRAVLGFCDPFDLFPTFVNSSPLVDSEKS